MMTREIAAAAVEELVDGHDGSVHAAIVFILAAAGARLAQSEGKTCSVRVEIVTGQTTTRFWADSFPLRHPPLGRAPTHISE